MFSQYTEMRLCYFFKHFLELRLQNPVLLPPPHCPSVRVKRRNFFAGVKFNVGDI